MRERVERHGKSHPRRAGMHDEEDEKNFGERFVHAGKRFSFFDSIPLVVKVWRDENKFKCQSDIVGRLLLCCQSEVSAV